MLAGSAGLLGAVGGSGPVARRRLLALRARRDGSDDAASDEAASDEAASARSQLALLARRAAPGWSVWVTRAAVVTVAVLVLAGRAGPAVPLAVAAAALLVPLRRRAAVVAHREARVARDLPRVADLMATCLEAGAAPADAVLLVCDVVGGPVRDALLPVASAIRLGIDPATAWAGLAATESGSALRRLARAFARAASSGAPLADTLSAVADDERERLRWEAQAAARRAGVRAVGPLAVCFLPAFLLLGVVPVLVSVAADVLGQLG